MARSWKKIERDACEEMRAHWFSPEECVRSAQAAGKLAADVTKDCLPGNHIEVKSRKAMAVWRYLNQAIEDKKQDEGAVVLMRADARRKGQGGNFIVCFRIEDTLSFIRGYLINRNKVWKHPSPSNSPTKSMASIWSLMAPEGGISLPEEPHGDSSP